MATYTTTQIPSTGVTYIVVEGDIHLADLKAYAQSAEYANRSDKVCCDLTNSTISALTTSELINFTRNAKHLHHPGIKGAFVVNKGVDVGILNIYKVYSEQLHLETFLEIFTEKEQAMEWLLNQDED